MPTTNTAILRRSKKRRVWQVSLPLISPLRACHPVIRSAVSPALTVALVYKKGICYKSFTVALLLGALIIKMM